MALKRRRLSRPHRSGSERNVSRGNAAFFLKQISNTRASGRGPVRRADATDDLISLKLHFEFTAPYVFNREVDTTIAFSARFDGLSHERISSRVVWI